MDEAGSKLSPLRFALQRLARHKGAFGLALIWSVVFVIVPLQVPVITGAVIDSLRGKHVRLYGIEMDPKVNRRERYRNVEIAALALLLVAAARGASAYLRQRCIDKLARNFVSETRQELLERVTTLPLQGHFKIGAGELLHRVVVDASAL